MNGAVKLPQFVLLSVSEQSAVLVLPVLYAGNTRRNLGWHVVKSRLLGMCDGQGGCCKRSEVSSSQFYAGVRSCGVWSCVSGLISFLCFEGTLETNLQGLRGRTIS
jgi:hypothetical protein